ncbi:peptidase S9, prolyl oligopeptidase active site domain protein [Pseudonocardia sp. Ae168_Ps1]|uniref:S9 family peptidase n=1 Tax=unclassified Pseudonocardia TaxID=2619320 RepID=UPI00094ACE4F|nr:MULTISPECIES: S9 family peptidase [unclassified Pseudonocardia]OLL73967.1 peptidase S9, prolyl oligopeptidase active site domain protein [Pseudonocardia sp. Ae150A_Ps1]OLL79945.1 peptidase S9, prolyl oligopeptidase active site domain protein [Pseudonocardia sp. Ae168_Ps1]OLL85921.1 peptidase S9, prolyl oligopeptidase active site domain protein [Pseudonocardia sp. Ae263_Ps1]OLL94048.1 peptidase S9, prolyl oligopeptidase active site domain protein [Pseudonocardia sp. Ae356_Ps1]
MALPDRIAVADMLRPPERTAATISPDGTRIAYLAPWKGRLNVWVSDVDGGTEPRCVTADEPRTVQRYHWSDDPRWLLYLQDNGGDENWHVHRVDLDDADAPAVDLTPFPGATAVGLELRPGRPGRVVLQLNARVPTEFDLCELDIASGELTVLAESPGPGSGWLLAGDTLLRETLTADGTAELWRDDERIATFDGDAYPVGVFPNEPTPDGTGLWFGSYRGTDHLHLARLDLRTGEETEVDRHPSCDVDTRSQVFPSLPSPLIRDRGTGELLGVRYLGVRQHTRALDPRFADVLAALEDLCDGDLSAVSGDVGGTRWVATFLHDRDPQTWFYDHATGERRLLFHTRGDLDPDTLAPMTPVTVTARDGRELPSYLTLPVGVAPAGLPLVLMPHGGPWARDWWGLDVSVQLWANRGYAVLQPQFRGSAGFGRAHMEAGVGELAGAMHDDLIDAVDWAVAQGYADPGRIAMFGGSYGGYATLVGVSFTPDRFAAAVSYVGISNLANFMRTVPEFAKPGLVNNWYRYVGDPADPEQEADLLARSPITRADDIRTPLMVVQGANDVRVVRAESDTMVAALRGRGVDVEYLVFDDEGHFIVDPENLLTMFETADRFLAEHLATGRRP